jgi:hypothetical protein
MSAATKDALCNRALSLLGEPPAAPYVGEGTSLRDIECRTHYDSALIEVLTHHRWDFATALARLDLSDPQPAEVPANFPHAYDWTIDDDILRLQEIRLSNGSLLEHFAIIGNHLYTTSDSLEGHILYTTAAVEPEEMLPIARECLTYALAVRIAESLTQSPQKVEQMRAHLQLAYSRAITTETRQTGSRENMDPLTLARSCGTSRARYYGFSR